MLERLGDFRLIDLLGEGGMGAVYRAVQESLGREVAVKILPESLTRNERFVQRFYREARSAAGLVHPSVIQIFSLGQDEAAGLHYYSMEYVRGKDLSQILKGGGKFSVKQALNIVMQVADALASAAEAGIIHRDIKPANIMLTATGQVKVMDFGLAKMVNDSMDVTAAGTVVGTANYMSPEQGQGKPLDCRTDIYSLGIVFYELLTGRTPFKADDPSAVIYQHIYEQPRKPSELNPQIPAAVDALVLRMMAKSPEERPADPKRLLEDLRTLRNALEGPPRQAARPAQAKARAAAPVPTPPAQAQAQAQAAAPEAPSRLSVEQRAGAGTVLVCDSSEYIRRMYRSCLEREFAVAAVGTGKECVELMEQGRPDLLILDLAVKNPGGFAVLDQLRIRVPDSTVLVISGDSRRETTDKLSRYDLAGVILKPVKLADLRGRVAELLGRAPDPGRRPLYTTTAAAPKTKAAARPAGASKTFVEQVQRQEAAAATGQLTVAGLASKLLGRQEPSRAELLVRRIRGGSPNQAITAIRDMFGSLPEDEAWKLVIFAFKEGDHRVRILASELAGKRFSPARAAELLTRFAADGDYRVRIAALRELAAAKAPGAAEFLERFLDDESHKVRREAARGMEKLSGGRRVMGALIAYYARNELPPPVYLQRLIAGPTAADAVSAVEAAAAKANSSRVRAWSAGLLGRSGSRAAAAVLLKYLDDQHPAVRTEAARSLAGFPTDMVKAALLRRLNDDRFGVLKAVAETLGVFRLQPPVLAMIRMFSATGKRIPAAAVAFIARCEAAAGAFDTALADIDSLPDPEKQALAFVLKRLYGTDEGVSAQVRRLRSARADERETARREVATRLTGTLGQ